MICTSRMDTLNTHIDASSTTMGTSETHSEKTSASDEEDFKLNIPYFEETNANEIQYRGASQPQQLISRNIDSLNRNQNASPDDVDDPNQLNYTNWDNDDMYGDDNVSRIGSDYSAQSTSESPNLYPPPGPPFYCGGDPNAIDIKYPPSELLLQPPSRYTSLQFEMQQQQQQQQRRHLQPIPPPHLQQLHPGLQHRHPQQPHHHPQYAVCGDSNETGPAPPYQQQQHPGFHHHPNMWYPNAPYGSSRYNYDPHRYPYHYNAAYGHDPMVDMLQLSNSGREARNRAEKNRRDKLNGSIQELSTMVPHVAESPRRVDKTAVLRFAAHGLRLKYVFGETLQQRTQITEPLMKLLDSFFITLTCHGQIVLISSSIEQHLGHCQADLYGQNILHITHPEDHTMLKHQLIPKDLENLFDVQPDDDSGEPQPRSKAEEDQIDKKLREDKRSFTVRLARAGPRSEPTAYEVVRIDGCFRRSDAAPRGVKNNAFPSSLQLIRRSRGRDDSIPLHAISGNDIVLIGIARIIRPPKVANRIIETNSLEYKTRHLIDGRIIDCDQRIGIVAGYMTDEVRNLSPFTFMHQDDARWVIVALRQMYDCNSSYGESTYRLLSRNGTFIYLQSRGYLEIDKNTNKVHSFVCINTLLNDEDGKRRVEEMKRKFSVIINTQIPPSSSDAPASENPQQLVKAVMHLIQNLQKSSDDEENSENDNDSNHITEDCKTHSESMHRSTEHRTHVSSSHALRSSKTPPLALVPPEAASVKSSITKSVSVVNITAARHLRGSQRLKSPISTTEDDDDEDDDIIQRQRYDISPQTPKKLSGCTCCGDADNPIDLCEYCRRYEYMQRVVADRATRKHKLSESFSSDADERVPQKRSLIETEIEQILSSPSDQIDRSVESEIKDLIEINEQNELFQCSSSDQQIIEEMENEIFVDVKTEYEVLDSNRPNIDSSTTKTTTQPSLKNDNHKKR